MSIKQVWLLLASAAFLCSATNLAARSITVDKSYYTTKDKEIYLTPEQLLVVIPGLEIEILNVEIPADMQPEVTYSIKDPEGLGLDHDGIYTPGATDMRFTLANIPMGQEQKVTLAYERIGRGNGTLTSVGDGVYKYKFETVLTSDQDTTHTLVLGGRRDLREFELDRYVDNAIYDWVPSGLFDAVPRDVISGETCNRCHNPLQEHGRWQSPNACTQCHNPGLVEDGVNYSLNALVHRVHKELGDGFPTEINNCEVCHTGGTPTENFPLVATPAAALVCDGTGVGETVLNWQYTDNVMIRVRSASNPEGSDFAMGGPEGSVATGKWVSDGTYFDLYDLRTGKLIQALPVNATVLGCVGNAPGTFRGEPATQHTNWLDHASRLACGSCHDDINWETGEGHSEYNIVIPDDNNCGNCHVPDSGEEFDRSIRGAHLELYKSAQFPGVLVKFYEVTNTGPDERPTVTFSVDSKNGPIDPSSMNRLRFKLSGPNDDFSFYASENVTDYVQSGDHWAYTFDTAIPADAEGSYTISVEARTLIDIDLGDELSEDERDTAENTQIAFAVTDSAAKPRRSVVSDYNCESCHSNLAFHGGNRHDPDYCVACHMPEATGDDQTIHFKYMIHSIHRGEDLENGFAIGNEDYSEVVFPGDLRDCDTCHVNDSQQLSGLPGGLLPTTTPQAWWSPTMPQAAACLSCHDGDDAAVHAYTNTTIFGEHCSFCHGKGEDASVDNVHAR
jgi:hypothetical protein